MSGDYIPGAYEARECAKAIYTAIYQPGIPDGDGEVMPTFEQAEEQDIGAYERAMTAAGAVLLLPWLAISR